MKAILLLSITLISAFLKLFAQLPPPSQQIQNEIQTQVNDFKNSLLTQNNINVPGMMLKILKVGEWEYTWKNGLSNLENNIPLANSQTFRIGDISQTFLAVAVLKLVQNNQINLSDSITTWLPLSVTSIIPNASSITIKQLLQQSSGIRDNLEAVIVNGDPTAPPIVVQWYTDNFLSNFSFNDIMNYYAANSAAIALPNNQFFNFSGINYLLLGKIIQNCSGLTWQEYVRQNIILPLNLTNTICPNDNDISLPSNFMSAYEDLTPPNTSPPQILNYTIMNTSIYKSSREMISNLDDLIVFWKSVRENVILPQNLSSLLQNCSLTFENDTSDNPVKYGISCEEFKDSMYEGQDWIGKIGVIEGFSSGMVYLPRYNAYMTSVANYGGVALSLMSVVDLYINNVYLSNSNFEENKTFNVYPNPTIDLIIISSKNSIDEIKIYDVVGRVVYLENKISTLEKGVDVSNFGKGNYFIKIKSDGKMSTQQFIKN